MLRMESRGIVTFGNGSIVAIIVTLSERAGGFHDRIHGDKRFSGKAFFKPIMEKGRTVGSCSATPALSSRRTFCRPTYTTLSAQEIQALEATTRR